MTDTAWTATLAIQLDAHVPHLWCLILLHESLHARLMAGQLVEHTCGE